MKKLKGNLLELFKEIEHGDQEHRDWLYDKMVEFQERKNKTKKCKDTNVIYNISGRIFDEYKNFETIELTEEILLKCGFEKDESWRMLFIKRPYLIYHDKYLKTNILGVFISGSYREYQTISKPFHHLHQLQNIYFALTGKELEIQL